MRKVARVVTARRQREGGGFIVRRPIGGEVSEMDPFLLLDHFGPVTHGPGEAIGAPDHPHRGFETVTYMLQGHFQHKDSQGNQGDLGPGWVQWMTAGSGVVHSEMPSDTIIRDGGTIEGFQLWVNLPAAQKMVPPRYQDTPPEEMPWVTSPDGLVSVKVIAGQYQGSASAIQTHTPIVYFDVRVKPGGRFHYDVPADHSTLVYSHMGAGFVCGTAVQDGQAALLGDGTGVVLEASSQELRALLIGARPIGELPYLLPRLSIAAWHPPTLFPPTHVGKVAPIHDLRDLLPSALF
eukprot:gene12459-2273_t